MASQRITAYTFNPTQRTVTLTGLSVDMAGVKTILDVTTGGILYVMATPSLDATAVGSVITLNVAANLAGAQQTDALFIDYDTGAGVALESGGNLAAIAGAAGTPADAAYSGSGAATMVMALKGLYAKLAGSLAVAVTFPYALGQKTQSASVPVTQASDPDIRPGAQTTTVADSASTTTAGFNSVNYIRGAPTAGSVVSQAINGISNVTIAVTSITCTLVFEISGDGGTTWVGATMRQRGSSATTGSTTGIGLFEGDVGGKTHFRVRQTTAGAATFTPAFTSSAAGIQVMNPVKLYDNTSNVQASIKAASTAAGATDTALVVAISPNNSVGISGTATVSDNQSAPFSGAVAMTVGTSYATQRSVGVLCTVAGNVMMTLSDASTLTIPVYVGWQTFPFAASQVVSAGTTATATYYNLK